MKWTVLGLWEAGAGDVEATWAKSASSSEFGLLRVASEAGLEKP